MKRFAVICAGLIMLICVPLWSQSDNPSSQQSTSNANSSPDDDRMLTPPPISGQAYPSTFTSEERSNYLRAGVAFTSGYSDNALGSVDGHPVGDASYSVWPTVSLDETRPRLHSLFTYSPGFTSYGKTSSRNEADQNALLSFEYRLSPHMTFDAKDSFQKSSNVLNQPDNLSAEAVSGGAQGSNLSVIPPVADHLLNLGDVSLKYQFAENAMLGGSGTFSNLHYTNPAQVTGLNDSSSQSGSLFFSLRVSKLHYLGATYQYQRLMSYPADGTLETQTHAVLFYYTLYPVPGLSLSAFGGPQYSNTMLPPIPPYYLPTPPATAWTPAVGGSVSWQGRTNNASLSYSHLISGGQGLLGAVHSDSANALLRQQIMRNLSAYMGGSYVQSNLVGNLLPGATNGHTVSGTAGIQQQFGQHWTLDLHYARVHQTYTNLPVVTGIPDTNWESVSLRYEFSRPLGR